MSVNMIVSRLISAVECELDRTGYRVVEAGQIGNARMVGETTARRIIHNEDLDTRNLEYLESLDTDTWRDQFISAYEASWICNLLYAVYDAYCETCQPVKVK